MFSSSVTAPSRPGTYRPGFSTFIVRASESRVGTVLVLLESAHPAGVNFLYASPDRELRFDFHILAFHGVAYGTSTP